MSGATPTPEPRPSGGDDVSENAVPEGTGPSEDAPGDAEPEDDGATPTEEPKPPGRPASRGRWGLSRRDLVLISAISLVVAVIAAAVIVTLTGGKTDDDILSVEEFLEPQDPGATSGSAEVGEPVPNLDLRMFDGTTTTLDELIDRPTVINVWASTCAPCLREMPDFERVHDDLGDRVGMLGIDSGETEAQGAPFAERVGATYPLAEDPDQAHSIALGLVALPMTLFVDADGTVAGQQLGAMDEAELRSNIERYLGVAS
ncbi:TlpA family protein disulfide reductase [Candidatus Microthrix sp.]|uniref:TlpA family protein disulfide reductase n=1 Tax=Candidatus Neomicrothrix sp. TaxID=2719034 RepID=UPI0025913C2C|nr:TlpA disulfide reductase family protein [Candidatus Microthrix sp.]MBK6311459.1 TlpA family protein disulfide reductase [Candidatus Microthrix sp.]MBK6970949.1 TlpA family protein disulfide reductase [Candidatus Microthrix sp.]MBK7165414.1 TlpA family protein disulfide reductase [Candidatus Microthrix sp.]HMS49068.1 TlpA disulfide reductase family protein [Candidatus Microthrix sp.]